jgi:citrate synthase
MNELSTRQVAERLGVKPETVYAYVSRGLLTSRPASDGRGSVFDEKDVEALARRNGRGRSVVARPDGHIVRTGITLITSDRHYYRGVDALQLAERYSFEQVADWLWTGQMRDDVAFAASDDTIRATRSLAAALPAQAQLLDRLRTTVVAAAISDPLRYDLSRDLVADTARHLVATLTDTLIVDGRRDSGSQPIAARLWEGLAASEPDATLLRCIDATLVLLIDHDLAASTLAARVAASARADPYAVLAAALGAFEGPLHGRASALAHKIMAEALYRGSAAPVVSELLRERRRVHGLGHRIYPAEDPRAEFLLTLLSDLPVAVDAARMAYEIAEAASSERRRLYPNIDLALAALTVSAGMSAEAGEVIFAVARTVGWIAHAIEEYGERRALIRPSGTYVGPRPPQPLPPPS